MTRSPGQIAAIINVTPDSFVADSRHSSAEAVDQAIAQAAEDGANMVDVGAVSTRPDGVVVDADEELRRLEPIWPVLRNARLPWSIDTFRADVAARAVEMGATMINDVTGGLGDKEMFRVAASTGVQYVLTHARAVGNEMAKTSNYANPKGEILSELDERLQAAAVAGLRTHQMWVDPGIGFSKKADVSLWALGGVAGFRCFGLPLYVGASRKSFLTSVVGDKPVEERLAATLTTVAWCAQAGVEMIRVHDVAASVDVVKVWQALQKAATPARRGFGG